MKKPLRTVIKQIEQFSELRIDEIVTSARGHTKVRVTGPSGKHTFFAASSPSDWRAEANNLALFRRWAKAEPVLTQPTKETT